MVKAACNRENGTWEYGSNGVDPYNIVAYRKEKLQVISNRYMNIYTVDSSIAAIAQTAQRAYQQVMEYYNGNLFRKKAPRSRCNLYRPGDFHSRSGLPAKRVDVVFLHREQ